MGIVYLAEDIRLGRQVAIKFCTASADDPLRQRRFETEARNACELNNEHIAQIYEYGESEDGMPFIAMEYVPGRNLSQSLREKGLSVADSVEVAESVAEALAEAHHKGVVHRDIKPSNIRITDRGTVKVLDFGLAKVVRERISAAATPADDTRTLEGSVVGTPAYMSPEQCRGRGVDGRSDLFALGSVLYECLTGKPAFTGVNAVEILARVMEVTPPPPSQWNPLVPRELDRIVQKLLAKDPGLRYQSAEEALLDLRGARPFLPDEPRRLPGSSSRSTAPITPAPVKTLSLYLRRPRFALVVGLISTALAAVLLWLWAGSGPGVSAEALRFYNEGLAALRDGTFQKASRALQRAVRIQHNFPIAHARLAESWAELDYSDRATEEMLIATSQARGWWTVTRTDMAHIDALQALVLGKTGDAVARYETMARSAPAAERAAALLDLGRAYDKHNETERAISVLQQCVAADPQMAAAFLHLGRLYARGGRERRAQAEEAFRQAESLYQSLSNLEGINEVLYQRAAMFQMAGELDLARPLLEKALATAKTVNNQQQQVKCLLMMSKILFVRDTLPNAEKVARTAVEIAQASGLENLTARALVEVGTAVAVAGDREEGVKLLTQALTLAESNHSERIRANALFQRSQVLLTMNRVEEGLRDVEGALHFYRQGEYRKPERQALSLIGRARRKKGDLTGAMQAYNEQLALARRDADEDEIGQAEEGLANALLEAERWPEALPHIQEALRIGRRRNDTRSLAFRLQTLGEVQRELGQFGEAAAALQEAESLARARGYANLSADVTLLRVETLLSQRQFQKAREAAAGVSGPDHPRVLASAMAGTGDRAAAQALCREAVNAAERAASQPYAASVACVCAEVEIDTGGAPQRAVAWAAAAEREFQARGMTASAWRAALAHARALAAAGDRPAAREAARRAAAALKTLEEKWGPHFQPYSTRPDVQRLRKLLNELM